MKIKKVFKLEFEKKTTIFLIKVLEKRKTKLK